MADLFSWISFQMVMYFNACKVQGLNLAAKKPAWMSSVPASHTVAANGVDGTHGTDIRRGDCIHTSSGDMSPWFVVDLLGQYNVHNVTIFNRVDCCGNRLHDFVIEVYVQNPSRCPSAGFTVCKKYTGTFGSIGNVVCDVPVFGRFIKVWKPSIRNKHDVLNFCELEVYGEKTDCQQVSFLMASSTRLVSSTIVSSNPSSRVSCVQQCMLRKACVGVNYNSGTRECQFLLRPEPTDTVAIDPDWVYYGDDIC